MLGPLVTVLSQSRHPYPSFGGRLAVLRWTLGGHEAAACHLGVPPHRLQRFEDGELHPGDFPRDALARAGDVVGSEDEWLQAVTDAGPPPATDEAVTRPDYGLVAHLLRLAKRWLGDLAVVPPAVARVLEDLGGNVGRVVAVAFGLRWAAYVQARRRDAAIRLGMWLGLAGVGTTVRGLLAAQLELPWANVEVGLGLAVCVLGYYLGAAREHLRQDEAATTRVNRRARRHRTMLALALVCLPLFAVWTSRRFQPPGPAAAEVTIAELGMAVGAVLATVACLVLLFVVIVLHHHPVPGTPEGQAGRNRRRVLLIRASTLSAGLACLVYGVTHIVASTFAPTTQLRIVLVVTAGMVCLAARECFHPPIAYARPVLVWSEARVRGGRSGLAAAEATVGIRRVMAEAHPLSRPGLATSLHVLAVRLGELGRREEALQHAEEAVRIWRELADADPAYQGDLAASLHLLAVRRRELGRRADALADAEEAVRIQRSCAEADPSHRTRLAASRHLHGVLRRELKYSRPHPVREAVTTLRLLTTSPA